MEIDDGHLTLAIDRIADGRADKHDYKRVADATTEELVAALQPTYEKELRTLALQYLIQLRKQLNKPPTLVQGDVAKRIVAEFRAEIGLPPKVSKP